MRSRVRLTSVVAVLAVLAAATGCGSGGGDEPGPSAGGSTVSPSTSSPPSVVPASGRQVRTALVSYRLPAHRPWSLPRSDGTFAGYTDENGSWQVTFDHTYAGVTDLGHMAKVSMSGHAEDFPKGALRQVADRTIDGHLGYVVEGRGPEGWYYEWGTAIGHDWAILVFKAPKDDAAARRMVESVIATVHWAR